MLYLLTSWINSTKKSKFIFTRKIDFVNKLIEIESWQDAATTIKEHNLIEFFDLQILIHHLVRTNKINVACSLVENNEQKKVIFSIRLLFKN